MDLEGTWYNELGSKMIINQVVNGGFAGTYTTAVSSRGCAQGDFPLVGRTDTDSGEQSVGFVVCWQNNISECKSVTSWSGQAQNINGEEQIIAFWLLTQETTPGEEWAATHIGQDVFTRVQPTAKEIAKKSKLTRRSHP